MKLSPEKTKTQELRRKQIQATLNELHRLQAEIYQLNVPQNPHSSAPVKKEVKQLTYLYENMTKPKTKNHLNIEKTDIQKTINLIEGYKGEGNTRADIKKLSNVMKQMFGCELQMGLITKGQSKSSTLSAEQLYQFINYNQFDNFDPIQDTYNLFVDEQGKFSFKKYKEYNQILGLPPITNEQAFRQTLGIGADDKLSFEVFSSIMNQKQ